MSPHDDEPRVELPSAASLDLLMTRFENRALGVLAAILAVLEVLECMDYEISWRVELEPDGVVSVHYHREGGTAGATVAVLKDPQQPVPSGREILDLVAKVRNAADLANPY